MSVFNEEEFLPEMLDSLFSQTHTNWRLIVRDNGSTDKSQKILVDRFAILPEKLLLIDGSTNPLPVMQSFSEALERVSADYVMFADGDDVWLNNKIEISFKKLQSLESIKTVSIPALVFTDLFITNASLDIIAQSMWKYQSLNPKNTSLNRVIMHDVACGNTFIFNKALLEKILPIPAAGNMHDIWASLIATCFGTIAYVSTPTIYYRQHGENTCGSGTIFSQLKMYLLNFDLIRKRISDRSDLANSFKIRFSSELNTKQTQLLTDLAEISKLNFFKRRYTLLKNSFYMNSLIRNIGLFTFI